MNAQLVATQRILYPKMQWGRSRGKNVQRGAPFDPHQAGLISKYSIIYLSTSMLPLV